jgi:hypothetical protein
MIKRDVALVSETRRLPFKEVTKVAAALNKQLQRDFLPVWNISAAITPFAHSKDIPADFWPLTVRDHIEPAGAWSLHSVQNGRPFVEVTYDTNWTLGASHDLLEMLVDPFVNRTMRARSVVPGAKGQVDYLVQVCDPCASPENGYRINDVLVADFCTPEYWTSAAKGKASYSFKGSLTRPLEIVKGGYLSWRDPRTNHWWQKVWWTDKPEYRDLGSYQTSAPEENEAGAAKGLGERRMRFQMVMLRDFYQAQEPRLRSIRSTVEELMETFG